MRSLTRRHQQYLRRVLVALVCLLSAVALCFAVGILGVCHPDASSTDPSQSHEVDVVIDPGLRVKRDWCRAWTAYPLVGNTCLLRPRQITWGTWVLEARGGLNRVYYFLSDFCLAALE